MKSSFLRTRAHTYTSLDNSPMLSPDGFRFRFNDNTDEHKQGEQQNATCDPDDHENRAHIGVRVWMKITTF